MAYLGRQPIIGNYQVLDAITASATATYALTKNSVAVFPQTPANCIVSLNGVIQAPFDSYTISGSNIVFASALTGSDSIDFITVLGDVLNVGTVSDGTIGLAKLSATGTKDATTFLRGDNTFAAAGGGVNTPAFRAYQTSIQTTLQNFTKITLPNEEFDTDNAFSSSRFTVPSGKGGIYHFGMGIGTTCGAGMGAALFVLYKNGSSRIQVAELRMAGGSINSSGYNPTFITNANAGDYFEFYYQMLSVNTSGGAQTAPGSASQQAVWFWGYRLIQ